MFDFTIQHLKTLWQYACWKIAIAEKIRSFPRAGTRFPNQSTRAYKITHEVTLYIIFIKSLEGDSRKFSTLSFAANYDRLCLGRGAARYTKIWHAIEFSRFSLTVYVNIPFYIQLIVNYYVIQNVDSEDTTWNYPKK